MKINRHWLSNKSSRSRSAMDEASFTSALKSIGSFFRFLIGNSIEIANTVFRHGLRFHLRVFQFSLNEVPA